MKAFYQWIRKWFLLLRRSTYIVFKAIVTILIRQYSKANNAQREMTKERLRYFNPIIKKDFWGDEIIQWVGRDKPLTDEELNQLMYHREKR